MIDSKVIFAFFSISLLLFSSTIVMSSYAQPQKVPSQGEELSPQLQQQLQKQQQPQLQQQQKQERQQQQRELQEEQQELKTELQQLQTKQQRLPTKNISLTYEEDVPSLEDLQRIQSLPSALRAKLLGTATGNQTSQAQVLGTATGNQTSPAQATINAPPPPTVLLNPPSTQLVDTREAIKRGCLTGLFTKLSPHWVTVSSVYNPVVAEGKVLPKRQVIAYHDWPFAHQSHDGTFNVILDPKYNGLLSTHNRMTSDGTRYMEMEWEIGTVNTGVTDRFPKLFWPWEGDRVWMMGQWVWDCGHFDPLRLTGWMTEIHPPFATAFTRDQPIIFPGENKPSSAKATYIYIHGRGGYYNTPVGGRNYEFDIPTPPKPFLPGAQLRYAVIGLPFGGPAPIVTPKSQLCNFDGTMSPCAHVVYPLSGIPASADKRFGAIVATKWIDPTTVTQREPGFRTLKVTFNSIYVRVDHDQPFSGEWDNLWVGVNGKWIELSGPLGHYGLHDVDNGEVIRFPIGSKSVTVIVPDTDKGQLKIQTSGWEGDNDGYYGKGLLSLPPPALALNDNDKIGSFIKYHTKTENFGIRPQPYSFCSARDGDSDTSCDFILNYRIEQLSITPPTTGLPVAPRLPVAPTQPPVLR